MGREEGNVSQRNWKSGSIETNSFAAIAEGEAPAESGFNKMDDWNAKNAKQP